MGVIGACPFLVALIHHLPLSLPSFDKDDSQQSKKLDEMDLDDILNRAEQHETVAAQNEGASLGGEGFLEQFANISDVKNDMNWEDIIPVEERKRIEREDDERKAEEMAAETKDRKRTHAPVSYEGMDGDPHSGSAPTAKKPRHPAPQRKTPSQKAMELKERDVRVLVRSLQKWGDIRQRYDTIVRTCLCSAFAPSHPFSIRSPRRSSPRRTVA